MIEPVIAIEHLRHCIAALSPKGRNSEFGKILRDGTSYPGYAGVEAIRNRLAFDQTPVNRSGLGAGSQQAPLTIAGISGIASVSARYGRLLFRITRHYKPDRIIEFGTALGISAMYLAAGNPPAALISVEGDPQLAAMARKNCQAAGLKNTTILNHTFREALPGMLRLCTDQTMVYIDGNHTFEATLEFYRILSGNETGIPMMVFDDIRWSPGMLKAWKNIRSSWHGMTIELTRMGILLKSPSGSKQILQFNY